MNGTGQFSEFLRQLGELLEKCGENNDGYEYYFRGEAKHHKNIVPSIYAKPSLIRNEDILFKECLRITPHEFHEEKTTFDKLVKMQHYSLPTRLLDITSNPLVALFFATEARKGTNKRQLNGRVIVFKVPKEKVKFSDSDTVAIISNICKRPYDGLNISDCKKADNETADQFVSKFNNRDDIGYLLHEIKAEKPYFQHCIRKCDIESVWCVKPMMTNPRIIKQDGGFLLFGIDGKKQKHASVPDLSENGSGDDQSNIVVSRIFDINANEKENIRKELNNLGYSEEKLYPDLEHTTKQLKERYGRK